MQLVRLGAQLVEQTSFIDTYFVQPKGKVLKITEKDTGTFVNIFQAVDGRFDVVKEEQVANPDPLMAEYGSKFGIKKVLKGRRKFYRIGDYLVTFNLIEGVGDFLILTGDNPTKDYIENVLKIEKPEYITVSFDEVET